MHDHEFVLIKSHVTRYVAFVMTLMSCLFHHQISILHSNMRKGHPNCGLDIQMQAMHWGLGIDYHRVGVVFKNTHHS